MKTITVFMAGILAVGLVYGGPVHIDGLESDGRLTASIPSNGVFSIEWSGSLSDPEWKDGWSGLRTVHRSNGVVDVEVPMFYRLTCWTNGLFVNTPVGRTYIYAASNALGQTWTEEIAVKGDVYLPHMSNSYRIVTIEHKWDSTFPEGAFFGTQTVFMRSTDESSFFIDQSMTEDVLDWKKGGAGEAWAFNDGSGISNSVEIVAIEAVNVAAGSFTDCIKLHNQAHDTGDPQAEWYEWIKPGLFMVKWVDYWIENTNAAPVIYELQSWNDG